MSTVAGPPAQFWGYALPVRTSGLGQTGSRRFGMIEDNVLRGDTDLVIPADAATVKAMNPIGN